MSWEDTFKSWSSPPGTTEQTKCDNAVRAIRKAIDAHSTLKNRSIKVFPQGSYRNRTNVRVQSDVDVCVYCDESFFFDLPEAMTTTDFQILTPASYSYAQYKNDVEIALTDYFGKNGVTKKQIARGRAQEARAKERYYDETQPPVAAAETLSASPLARTKPKESLWQKIKNLFS